MVMFLCSLMIKLYSTSEKMYNTNIGICYNKYAY